MCPYCKHDSLGRIYQLEEPHEFDTFIEWCRKCGYSASGKGDTILSVTKPFQKNLATVGWCRKCEYSANVKGNTILLITKPFKKI